MRIIIVEDELLIAEGLRIMLESMGYEIAGMFRSGKDMLKNFKPGMADMLFMDIHLDNNTNGVDTAMEIRKTSDIPVIYLTNNQDEKLRKKAIFETNAVQYLSKPFTRTDISTAIDFALKTLKNAEFTGTKAGENAYLLNDSLFLKNGTGFKKIKIADIMYLKAEGSYCDFYFKEQTQLFCENLSFFEEKLAFAKELVRIHRSYIVNINSIERLHENRVWIGGVEIPIGKTYKNVLTEIFRFI